MKRTAIGPTLSLIALFAWSAAQVLAQGTGGTGSGTSGTSGAAGTGNASTGTTQTQAGAQSTTGQPAATGAAGSNLNQAGPNQATNNLLLESPGVRAQQQPGGQTPALRPFDGQATSRAGQANQLRQNPADITVRPGHDRSMLNAPNVQSLAERQRDALRTIGFRAGAERGLTIETLGPGSIFYDSGLRPGDVILAIGGQQVLNQADFERLVVSQWGQRIPATVWRDGREETIFVTFPQSMEGPMNGQLTQDQPRPYQANRPVYPSTGPAFLGVGFDTTRYNTASVRDVLPGSAAEQAGLREGDVIVALNGQPVTSFREAMQLIGSMQAGDRLEIEYTRRMPNRATAVLGGRPTSGPGSTGTAVPSEEDRYYRGDARTQEPAPTPPNGETTQQQEQPQAAPPTDRDATVPPPETPPDADRNSDLPF